MQKQTKAEMLNVSIQQAYEWVKTGHWSKAAFIVWAEARMDYSYDCGWDAARATEYQSN